MQKELSPNFDGWCKRADEVLCRAKSTGRNKVVASNELEVMPIASVCIGWKQEWECGNSEVDTQHKQLIEIANRLINMSYSGISHQEVMRQLDALLSHIANHFKSEESVLRSVKYPGLSEHSVLHTNLISEALRLKESYKEGQIKASAFFSFVLDVVLLGHMVDEDTRFFPYLKNW